MRRTVFDIHSIRYFFEQAEKFDKLPHSFYIVTNGMTNQTELAAELLKIYPLIDKPEMCGAALSVDEWHDATDGNDFIRVLVFYRTDKEYDSLIPIKEGRAALLKMAKERWMSDQISIDEYTIDMLYVAANGNLI